MGVVSLSHYIWDTILLIMCLVDHINLDTNTHLQRYAPNQSNYSSLSLIMQHILCPNKALIVSLNSSKHGLGFEYLHGA